MKTGKWILIIMVVAIVFAFGGCESKSISSVSLNPPDKINIYAVEFVYDKPQRLTISNGNKKQVQFTEIILPLSERWQNIAFVKIKDNFYTPIGLNENLDYLVKASVK
ncbi:hypothetical protein [Clostridium magnum]|uniref:Uncharacterized protein n=1 Tax=Clostridium magnum DSM 2767 TaxID=1121326 RepID=A0A161WFI7_9CLOT|nr:hypothetical protein [Clostridium magnum]KZL90415.1 hypothetical protein CLMAG_41860 [Clostridium magnum DSM 2767]SHH84577.1 hypothetical protein SAMN02745944_01563 [Clostridium magnum DSM 2767]